MKLRIKGNSIRLRLLRSEAERLGATGIVSEEIKFGPSTSDSLKYTLSISDEADELRVRFSDNEILVVVPRLISYDWIKGATVGLEGEQGNGTDSLSILIEKDFACIDSPNDPDCEDTFPNPRAACQGGA